MMWVDVLPTLQIISGIYWKPQKKVGNDMTQSCTLINNRYQI